MSQRRFTLGALADALDATLEGDAGRVVTGVAALDAAGPDDVSFLVDPRYGGQATASRAAAIVVPEGLQVTGPALLRVRHGPQALIRLLTIFHPRTPAPAGVHASAVVSPTARVDDSASVGPLAVVEADAVIGPRVRIHALAYVGAAAEIGEDSEIHPGVVLGGGVRLGRRVIVYAGAVIGADGFGYTFDGTGHRKIPQVGTVVLEDDVEIGANAAVDRATLGATIVRRGTKVDNLVQIGHNVEIGEHSILVAQVGISGSCRLGRGVILGGQVGVADHLTVGDGVMVAAQSGVAGHVAAGAKVLGTPARPLMQAKRIYAAETHLPDLGRRLRDLERRLERLEGRADGAPDV